jgi:hypothetical protein
MSSVLLPPERLLVSPPVGRSSLPIVELERKAVAPDGKHIRFRRGSKERAKADCSLGSFTDTLLFDAWSLFHAAKKTEFTTSFTNDDVNPKALCFAEEYKELLVWNSENLRRVSRSVFGLVDFSETGLGGRLGEAIAYLTMLKWGYIYWDRIAVLWERAAVHSGLKHPEMVANAHVPSSRIKAPRPSLEPDFAFERATGDVALMEAKGSFVDMQSDSPSIKGDLRNALSQLEAWSAMVEPTPKKSYAIGTYFRDESDDNDPSLITYVDPPGHRLKDVSPVRFPDDWIRRGNYGAWIIGMGFPSAGEALRTARNIERTEHPLTVVEIGRSRFAVTFQGLVVKRERGPRVPNPELWLGVPLAHDWRTNPQVLATTLRGFGFVALRVLGIEINTLRLIEKSLSNPDLASLLRVRPTEFPAGSVSESGFTGSVFPDGTLFGDLSVDVLATASEEPFLL